MEEDHQWSLTGICIKAIVYSEIIWKDSGVVKRRFLVKMEFVRIIITNKKKKKNFKDIMTLSSLTIKWKINFSADNYNLAIREKQH